MDAVADVALDNGDKTQKENKEDSRDSEEDRIVSVDSFREVGMSLKKDVIKEAYEGFFEKTGVTMVQKMEEHGFRIYKAQRRLQETPPLRPQFPITPRQIHRVPPGRG